MLKQRGAGDARGAIWPHRISHTHTQCGVKAGRGNLISQLPRRSLSEREATLRKGVWGFQSVTQGLRPITYS